MSKIIEETVTCYYNMHAGIPVTQKRYGECGRWHNETVGIVIDTEYLGDYKWRITVELKDEALLENYLPISSYGVYIEHSPVLVNEYLDEYQTEV